MNQITTNHGQSRDIFLHECGPDIKVSVRVPDVSVECGPRDAVKNLSTFNVFKFSSVLAVAVTNSEIEEAIVKEEQSVIDNYFKAGVALWVVVQQLEETEKAVKVKARVARGESEPAPGTSQFWVPRTLLFEHNGRCIVSKQFVDQKLKELQEKSGAFRRRPSALAKPQDVICLPEVNWANFFAVLRAQIPPNVSELVAEYKEKTARLRAERQARVEEHQRSLPARMEAARIAEIKTRQEQANKAAAERARVAALETLAETVTVHGYDYVGPKRAPRRESWTLNNVTVKKAGARAYILDASGAVLRFKPLKNITIIPTDLLTSTP